MIQFTQPIFFILLPIVLLLVWRRSRQKHGGIFYSSIEAVKQIKIRGRVRWMWVLAAFRFLALLCIVLGLARPQSATSDYEVETEGIDIVIAMDISGSMLAEDFKPKNRFMVSLEEAKKFIQARPNDRIGLVVFASQAYTQCPLTLDHDVLISLIDEVRMGVVKDGTAIGLGIATAINRLKDSEGKSKVIILLTDGENNAGNLDPITAAELARSFGIKVYAICIGKGGLVPFPIDDPIFGKRYVQAEVKIDEKTLKRISDITDGVFFKAGDPQALEQAYRKINEMETSEIKVKEYSSYKELYHYYLIPGILFFLIELLLANTIYQKIP